MRGPGSRYLYAPFHDPDAVLARLEARLAGMETVIARLETDREVNKEKHLGLEARFTHIDRRLDRIEGLISRLVWLIIAALVGGVMSFVLGGNLLPG